MRATKRVRTLQRGNDLQQEEASVKKNAVCARLYVMKREKLRGEKKAGKADILREK